jgi:SAM-dependent methyltransferase
MQKSTTSIHRLNADRGLGVLGRRLYFGLNWANNRFPYARVDPHLEITNFASRELQHQWHQLPLSSSPSRKLSDLFWLNLPWDAIQEELGPIHILDTGCGSGNLGVKLMTWSGNRVTRYTGIDAAEHPNWRNLQNRNLPVDFTCSDADHIRDHIPAVTNFIISQSAIEHFNNDLWYFKEIRDHIDIHRMRAIQIHLIPPSSCLRLYRLHGIRQYTPRTISTITRLFDDSCCKKLYNLGGDACNRLHYEFIVKPGKDLRNQNPQEYDRKLMEAIYSDMENPSRRPAFYALAIQSNWKKKVI